MFEDAPVNTGAVIWPEHDWAQVTVRRMQAKLHCWAAGDPGQGLGKVGSWDPDLRVCGGAGVTDVACVAIE